MKHRSARHRTRRQSERSRPADGAPRDSAPLHRRRVLGGLAAGVLAAAAAAGGLWWWLRPRRSSARRLAFKVHRRLPHDAEAFTQGLVFDGTHLLEGTGRKGRSELRRVELETGRVLQRTALPPDLFGEGIALVDNHIVQLTWRARKARRYDKETFELLEEIAYSRQGWGITYDGTMLIASDGSSSLYFLDRDTLETRKTVRVTDAGYPVGQLNELEYARGHVWANVWYRDEVAVIHPESGMVVAWLDLSKLRPVSDTDAVLNGIAYDPSRDRFFFTGKNWPVLYELEIEAL